MSIFCDESKNRKIPQSDYSEAQNWNYIGVCIVPTVKLDVLSKKFNNCRCGSDEHNNYMECIKKCKYHIYNKKKIHFTDSQNGYIYKTANKWTDIIIDNWKKRDFFINILGIDYCKLDKKYFKSGSDKTNIDENIYCRFFRTAILYGIKNLLSDYENVYIDNIYHDIGNMEYHKYFKQQVIKYVNWNEEHIYMNCDEITFIQTTDDNCLQTENVFLQLIDIFLGETITLLHDDVINEKKKDLSLKLFNIINHCLKRPNNKNSNYYKLYSVGFFPKYLIKDDMDELEKALKRSNNFFNNRDIKLSKIGKQISFFDN